MGSATIVKSWEFLVSAFTGEFILTLPKGRLANGGSVVLARAVWASVWTYLVVIALRELFDPRSTSEWSTQSVRQTLFASRHVYGGVFAAIYLALYTRFSQQWQYLANLYNQISSVEIGMLKDATPEQRKRLAVWKAAFIEDAYTVHLIGKKTFVGVVGAWAEKGDVMAYVRREPDSAKIEQAIKNAVGDRFTIAPSAPDPTTTEN